MIDTNYIITMMNTNNIFSTNEDLTKVINDMKIEINNMNMKLI